MRGSIMPPELLTTLTQFGVAGLIGWMWLTERKASTERDRQLTESHQKIIRQSEDRAALVEALRDCTRAMVALECAQRALVAAVGRAAPHQPAPGAGTA
tara:strand:- start:4755 stop:5051 length:297 start_codon:yes stop_codon:yes gene_type:complete